MSDSPAGGHAEAACLTRVVRSLTIVLTTFLLLATAWLAVLVREEIELRDSLQTQQLLLQNAQRIRDSLDSLATGVQQLARDGNGNARTALAELNKLGVVLTLNADSRPPGHRP